jgi:Tfp pilus assembly ATPase PilU
MQLGARDGSVLMDNCLYDLYSKCLITYDAAISRARSTDRFKPNAD